MKKMYFLFIIIVLAFSVLIFLNYKKRNNRPIQRIAIIGAMTEEVDELINKMKIKDTVNIADTIIYEGELYNQNVIVTNSGIGMVSSAMITSILNEKYDLKYLIFSGVAGAIDERLQPTDIVISTDLISYLFDATVFGYKLGEIPRLDNSIFKADIDFIKNNELKANGFNIHYGRILSGDKFVSKKEEKIYYGNYFNALAVDMESAAFAQVCYKLNKKFVVIRSISDSINDENAMEYNKFLKKAVKNNIYILEQIMGII